MWTPGTSYSSATAHLLVALHFWQHYYKVCHSCQINSYIPLSKRLLMREILPHLCPCANANALIRYCRLCCSWKPVAFLYTPLYKQSLSIFKEMLVMKVFLFLVGPHTYFKNMTLYMTRNSSNSLKNNTQVEVQHC